MRDDSYLRTAFGVGANDVRRSVPRSVVHHDDLEGFGESTERRQRFVEEWSDVAFLVEDGEDATEQTNDRSAP